MRSGRYHLPWDAAQSDQHAKLKTNLVFEQGYLQSAKNESVSANVSFWIKSRDFTEGLTGDQGQRELLFKPTDGEAKLAGLPKGGSAMREVFCRLSRIGCKKRLALTLVCLK